MDPVSQGLVGAAVPGSVSNKNELRLAVLVGFLSGLLADIDVLIRSSQDPLLSIDYHRHFTHSLIIIPLGGLVAAGILWIFLRRRLGFGKIYIYATLGYATHSLLDACTNYGTSLLWPFSEMKVAWNIVSVIDPVFTLTLTVLLIIALLKKSTFVIRMSLVFALLYLFLGYSQRERAEDYILAVAGERGHRVERVLVHPSIGNLLVWRSVYEADGMYYTDAVRVGPLSGPMVYEGGSIERFDVEKDYPGLSEDTVLYGDIKRFNHFSNGFLAVYPEYPNIIGDLRYSILPNGVKPLWGIEIDIENEDEHIEMADYERTISGDDWRTFLAMLLGRPVD